MSGKLHKFRKIGTELASKRYAGIVEEHTEDLIPYDKKEYYWGNYMKNFIMAGRPISKEILIAEKLLKELEEEAIKKDVDLSSLITIYLLKMLEGRNRTTRINSNSKTKGKIAYIVNNLYEHSNFIQYVESKEEFEENIFKNKKLERELTYKDNNVDEYIYIENYLINRGYSKEQIEELQKEEREKFGTYESHGITMINPYDIVLEITLTTPEGKEIEALRHDYREYVFISSRLGLHYVLMNKKNTPKTYEGIEELINKGGYKVWDYYEMFLSEEFNKKWSLPKVE